MMQTPANWAVTSYTNDTWTEVVGIKAIIDSVVLANTSGSSVTVQLRIELDGATRAVLLPPTVLAANSSHTTDLARISLPQKQTVQMQATAAGVHVLASGVIQ